MKSNQCYFQIIFDVAKGYNQSWLLIEVNDIGDQVASILQYDLEYENILMATMRGRNGQIVGTGFSGKKTQLGVRQLRQLKNWMFKSQNSYRR